MWCCLLTELYRNSYFIARSRFMIHSHKGKWWLLCILWYDLAVPPITISPLLTKNVNTVCLCEWKTEKKWNASIKFTVQFTHSIFIRLKHSPTTETAVVTLTLLYCGLYWSVYGGLLSLYCIYFLLSLSQCKCCDVFSAHRAWLGLLHSWYLCVPELLRDSS